MADNRAIQAVGEAVANLLRGSHDPADFGTVLDFRVITSGDFGTNQITAGASLFLYRVIQNGSHRIPAGRLNAQGQRLQTRLPVDLHYLVTFWGADASMQHAHLDLVVRDVVERIDDRFDRTLHIGFH